MNREHQPCGTCNRFTPTGGQKRHQDGPGHCSGWERDVLSTDQPCVLFNERGTWSTRRSDEPVRDHFARERRTTPR